MQKII